MERGGRLGLTRTCRRTSARHIEMSVLSRITWAAKTAIGFVAFTVRLKPCCFKTKSAAGEVLRETSVGLGNESALPRGTQRGTGERLTEDKLTWKKLPRGKLLGVRQLILGWR